MDFSFSEEQTLLNDSIERFVQNDYAFEARQKAIKQDPGYDPALWSQFAELGWLGVAFPES